MTRVFVLTGAPHPTDLHDRAEVHGEVIAVVAHRAPGPGCYGACEIVGCRDRGGACECPSEGPCRWVSMTSELKIPNAEREGDSCITAEPLNRVREAHETPVLADAGRGSPVFGPHNNGAQTDKASLEVWCRKCGADEQDPTRAHPRFGA